MFFVLSCLPRLPHELYDRIIDLLHDDKDALKACSLTCHCFRPRARFHIFHTLSLNADAWPAFQRLRETAPTITTLVRNLKITHSGNFSDKSLSWNYRVLNQMLTDVKASAYGFSAVTKLELYRVALTAMWADMIVQHFLMVEELRLIGCVVSNTASLQKVATSFPYLKRLKMGDLFIMNSDGDIKPPTRPLISVLRFPAAFIDPQRSTTDFLCWMMQHSLHSKIGTLEIPIHNPREAFVLRQFLKARGCNLQHLYLGLECEQPEDDLLDTPLSLAPCTGLRTLGFWTLKIHRDEPGNTTPHLGWVPMLLSQVNSSDLEHIHFRVRAGGATLEDLNAIDWWRVDEILARREFEGLRKVTVEIIRGEAVKGQMIPFIRSRVPGLEARKIVRFVHRLHDV